MDVQYRSKNNRFFTVVHFCLAVGPSLTGCLLLAAGSDIGFHKGLAIGGFFCSVASLVGCLLCILLLATSNSFSSIASSLLAEQAAVPKLSSS
jgi:hypothetical protein